MDASLAQELVRLIPSAVVIIDEEQRIVHFNPAAEEIFKTAAEEVQGRPMDVLLPREIIETHRSQVQAFLESGETVRWLNQRNLLSAPGKTWKEGTCKTQKLLTGTQRV